MVSKLLILGVLYFLGLFAKLNDNAIVFKYIPYGTIYLSDSIYIDKQPIKVYDYLEFLADIRRSYTPSLHDSIQKLPLFGLSEDEAYHIYDSLPMDTVFYNKMLTRIWKTVGNDKHIYEVDFHLTRAKYYNYPMVNMNYHQIVEYCKWRTDKVKLKYAVECSNLYQRKKYPINFEYRIVKRKEWEKAMGTFFEDVGKIKTIEVNPEMSNLAKPYVSKKKKKFCYESINAAEYLDDNIITIGFNWIDEAGIGDVSYMNFERPTDWITFRCVCEILPDKVNSAEIVSTPAPAKKPEKKKIVKQPKKEVKGIKTEKAKKKLKRK
ncbi:MAG: SUMF1/EgtB/PvdO family nonheme iron enzyme [Bacteroidales bacterium]|nr:SUMF1/EgtB/PvdO family nonheme iron enzyme [Bacteroidales bacterium]